MSLWLAMVPPAEASWTPVSTVSAAGWMGIDAPTVAADRHGDFLLAWAACKPVGISCPVRAQARIKPRGGAMGPVMTLSPSDRWAFGVVAATDDAGDSAVVWGNGSQVVGRRISATGSAGPLRILSSAGARADPPLIASPPSGDVLVVWWQDGSAVARYFHKDGSLGPGLGLGPSGGGPTAVAVDRLGAAVVAWGTGDGTVEARRIAPGRMSPVRTIAAPDNPGSDLAFGGASVGVDRDGDAVICFLRVVSTGPAQVWARRWSRTGRLGRLFQVSGDAHNVSMVDSFHQVPVVASDLAGDSMALWTQDGSSGRTLVFGRRISATGILGPITYLGVGATPAVTFDDNGDGLAAWQSPGSITVRNAVYGRRISRSGRFGPRILLSSNGRFGHTASTPWGHFAVIWAQSFRPGPWPVQARFGP